MKTKGLIAGACALAFGLSALTVEANDWFDADIGNYTSSESWTNTASITGGAWQAGATEAATLDQTAGAGKSKLVVDAEDDVPLYFEATNAKDVSEDDPVITAKVTFNAFDSLPDVPDAKAAVIAVTNKTDSAYDFYGLVRDGVNQTNDWVKLNSATASSIEDIDVTITFSYVDSTPKVSYKLSKGSTTICESTAATVYLSSPSILGAAFSGCGEVASLDATCAQPKATLTVANDFDNMSVVVVSNSTTETEITLDSSRQARVGIGDVVVVYFAPAAGYVFETTTYSTTMVAGGVTINKNTAGIPSAQKGKARIGDVYYLTLEDANDNALSTDTITLLTNYVISANDSLTIKAKALAFEDAPGTTTVIILEDVTSSLIYKDEGVLKDGNPPRIVLGDGMTGKQINYDTATGTYSVITPGTVLTIVKGTGVSSITIEDNEGHPYTITDGKITVDKEQDFAYLVFTVAASVSNSEFSVSSSPELTFTTVGTETGVFEIEKDNIGESTITFTATEKKPAGFIFTLTATGISAPKYVVGDDTNDFTVVTADSVWQTAALAEDTEFTVIYTTAFAIPSAAWTNVVGVKSGTGPTFTMDGAAASATLSVIDAGNLPDTPAGDAAAVDAIEQAAKDSGLSSADAAKVRKNVADLGVTAVNWIKAKSGVTYEAIATVDKTDVETSCIMGADTVVENATVTMTSLTESETAGEFEIKVKLTSGASTGDALKYAEEQVKELFQGVNSLSGTWSSENVTAEPKSGSEGNDKTFTVAPVEPLTTQPSAFFIRLKIK